jgi:hypothetical protein
MRMFASRRGVFVALIAMFVSRVCVLLRLFVLAKIVMVCGLMMMMRGCVMIRGGLMMVITRRMLRGLCHGVIPPQPASKNGAG